MNSPLVLVLLGGVCLAALGPMDAVHAIPENMIREIKKLTEHFNISADKALFGSPIFLQDINSHDKFEENEQRLVLQESLDVYIRILTDMLNGTRDAEIKMSIRAIRARMEDLRKNYFHSGEQALMVRLQELWALKTSDATVQRKAVRELLPMLQRAFQLCGRKRGLRHRRRADPALNNPLPTGPY